MHPAHNCPRFGRRDFLAAGGALAVGGLIAPHVRAGSDSAPASTAAAPLIYPNHKALVGIARGSSIEDAVKSAVALAGALLAVLAHTRLPGAIATGPLLRRSVALRRKSWGAAFQRQRDPDAAGRARPRAPSAVPAAA